MDWYPWVVFAHIVGAFGFAAGHGTSALMAFRLRHERDPARIAGMLDLSLAGIGVLTWSGLLLLASGIAGGFINNLWGKGWIWASLALLIVIGGMMTPFGAIHYNKVRRAIGVRLPREKADAPLPEPASAAELEVLLTGAHPWILAAVGGGGFVLILALMRFRPF